MHRDPHPPSASRRVPPSPTAWARGRWARRSLIALGGIVIVAGALLLLDRIFPPDLGRAQQASVVVTDRDGGILRAFETADGAWRLPTRVEDVDPRYLSLLCA